MKVISLTEPPENIINEAVFVLSPGGLIVYPTETCYGIGADATNSNAIDKVLKFKGGRKSKPISVAVSGVEMAKNFAVLNPSAENIFNNLLPGPITVVCEGKHKADSRLESESGTLGLRFPDYPLLIDIIRAFGKPITSTSANISGGKVPYEISDVFLGMPEDRKNLVDLIIDAGKLPPNSPSVVVDTTLDKPEILRQGKIKFDELDICSVVTNREDETIRLGKSLTEKYLADLGGYCLLFALQGELGAGKTQFAKGMAQALEIDRTITSPTFNLVNEYKFNNGIFYHLDAWRMHSPEELTDLGIEFMIKPGNVIAIEWVEKGREVLEKIAIDKKVKFVYVELEHLDENKRRVKFFS